MKNLIVFSFVLFMILSFTACKEEAEVDTNIDTDENNIAETQTLDDSDPEPTVESLKSLEPDSDEEGDSNPPETNNGDMGNQENSENDNTEDSQEAPE